MSTITAYAGRRPFMKENVRGEQTLHSVGNPVVGSDIKPIFIILVDISGYTKFIRYHKVSLLHAEKIVAQLMESILEKVEVPVMAHEILGDAISLYAIDEGEPGQAENIYRQLEKYFKAFREREASLISSCSLCECDACKTVGKLKLKAILHHGHAAFTWVHQIRKISGEDVITGHRLLKNTVPAGEYILMTKSFTDRMSPIEISGWITHSEKYDDIGDVNLKVKILDEEVKVRNLKFFQKVKGFYILEKYLLTRLLFKKRKLHYRNLPE
jgi:hypothetical protein